MAPTPPPPPPGSVSSFSRPPSSAPPAQGPTPRRGTVPRRREGGEARGGKGGGEGGGGTRGRECSVAAAAAAAAALLKAREREPVGSVPAPGRERRGWGGQRGAFRSQPPSRPCLLVLLLLGSATAASMGHPSGPPLPLPLPLPLPPALPPALPRLLVLLVLAVPVLGGAEDCELPKLPRQAGEGGERRRALPHPIGALATSRAGGVLVASGSCLYELDHTLDHCRSQLYRDGRGDCGQPAPPPPAQRPRPGSSYIKLLLPYLQGEPSSSSSSSSSSPPPASSSSATPSGLLLTGWTFDRGACEVRSLDRPAGPVLRNGTEVVSCHPQGSTAGVVYQAGGQGPWFLAVAATYVLPEGRDGSQCNPAASDRDTAIALKDTDRRSLPSKEEDQLKLKPHKGPLHFVDAFLWNGSVFFPYYPYNYTSGAACPDGPRVAVIEQSAHELVFQGQAALQCGQPGSGGPNRTLLLASSPLPDAGLWAGVFSANGAQPQDRRTRDTTALCLFRLDRIQAGARPCHGDFQSLRTKCGTGDQQLGPIQPIESSTLIHSDLTSVYGTVVLNRIILFLGTGDGQLLKVILDETLKSNCPEVIYEIKEETPVFHKLALDPLDNTYIYLPAEKEIRRIRVANCDKHKSCKECLTAMDPHCGWCHLLKRCTFQGDCSSSRSNNWLNISSGAEKCPKIQIIPKGRDKITVTAMRSFMSPLEEHSSCVVKNAKTNKELCKNEKQDVNCTCTISTTKLTERDLSAVQVSFSSGSWNLSETFDLTNCSSFTECLTCIETGCTWCKRGQRCVHPLGACDPPNYGTNQDVCQAANKQTEPTTAPSANSQKFSGDKNNSQQFSKDFRVHAIEPQRISTLGKTNVIVRGENFPQTQNIYMILKGTSTCKEDVIRVNSGSNATHLKFSLPSSRKEMKDVRIMTENHNASFNGVLSYVSPPVCFDIYPNTTWMRGGQTITIGGRNFDVLDSLIISDELKENLSVLKCCSETNCSFSAVPRELKPGHKVTVKLRVQDTQLTCGVLQYLDNPKFTGYRVNSDVDSELEVKILKENDDLFISKEDIVITLFDGGNKPHNCTFENITRNQDLTTILCKIKGVNESNYIKTSSKVVRVKLGNFEDLVKRESVPTTWYFLIVLPVLLLSVIVAAVVVTRYKSKQLSRKQSQQLELLESELRKEIRDGFAELQMDKLDVVDSFGTVPFLDYKHFALRTFFPESGDFTHIFYEDIHGRDTSDKNESLIALDGLICNKSFLVTVIHTLEKQKNFSVKDRCLFASFLTIALQTKLVYLTNILEVLTKDLMEQSSNLQPKLMLRRTESVVEKLLTNWMSVCLSGFLRETVGEPFYLLVTTLNQKINKGPVDVITCKALYTLNEDWLLWQVPDFNTVALNVVFEKIPENESADVCRTIPVNVLDCDTIGQAKEKIFQAFLSKNGSLYGLQLNEIGLELQLDGCQKELLDIDNSSVTLEDGIMKLNTIGHYEISNGATLSVFKKINFTSDMEYSDEHCHLILPDSEAFQDVQGKRHKGKHKFKVKEMYLTKLLSTKVAIHSVLEKLFRSIWSLPNNRAPVAIKYFFDFLDAQAELKKITDPDVVHIWKTNSLPLRFWVNILKNPQFVFDIKKTPHIDGCLSVIAQAFMDAFSLAEQQLGKEAPTNKLLYAKDIPNYKEEVKSYYKAIRDLPPLSTSEIEEFLTQESKKHENEFNEEVALTEIYKYIIKYFDEIINKLERERGLEDARKQLLKISGCRSTYL
uniref:Plexin C1 n=2 Tax=Ornithorhynchus anatinus TaxID=9258 RepID=F6Q464_ORNAN